MGRSSRSNAVTYLKAYDYIRELFAQTKKAKARKLKGADFSFNVSGGRCETCQGEGIVRVEMQFMADVSLTCDSCKGRRFKPQVLEVVYQDKAIDEVLGMQVATARTFFDGHKALCERLDALLAVGLDYLPLGQPSSTLSGGEAQRVKLAAFLMIKQASKAEKRQHILFIFDEPTTGLHMHDIGKLLQAIQALIDKGHSVIVVEHNLEVIKSADWVIDLGPEPGDKGGEICFEGTPEALCQQKNNHTARYLKQRMP